MYLVVLKIGDHIVPFLVQFYNIFTNLAQENFFFIITNMESTKCENNTIEHNKHVLNLIIKGFKELIGLYRFKTDKKTVKILRKAIRNREKIVYDEEEDDIEYIKDNINGLKNLKNTYFDRNKYHGYRAEYLGTDETIKYLFKDDEEDYNIYEINQQYQSFSNKSLLALDEYFKKLGQD